MSEEEKAPSPDQQVVFDGIMDWERTADAKQMITLGGLAGCGKTFTVAKLAKALGHKKLAFAAPTGKAALVLAQHLKGNGIPIDTGDEEGGHFCGTLHKLMMRVQEDPKTGRILGWSRKDEIDADLIIIDEASMVDQVMAADVLSYGIPVLAVGDHGQNSPVNGGRGLVDDPDFKLEKIHRQAADNPIIQLAHFARQHPSIKELMQRAAEFDDERIMVREGYSAQQEAMDFAEAPSGMAIVHSNAFRCELNIKARKWQGYKSPTPMVGEVLICLKNIYKPSFAANGQRGVVKALGGITDDHVNVLLDFDDGKEQWFKTSIHQYQKEKTISDYSTLDSEHEFKSWYEVGGLFDYGYAITCQKSQGSSAKNVAVFLQGSLNYVMTPDEIARWCYTATTRSSENLMLIDLTR